MLNNLGEANISLSIRSEWKWNKEIQKASINFYYKLLDIVGNSILCIANIKRIWIQ